MDLVLKIIKDYTSFIKAGKVIKFCWIPSHINIPGNERADTAAKAALCLPVTSTKLPASEFKPCTSRFCLEQWQDIWNSAANNKLHAIYPTVGKRVHNNLVSRSDAVMINRWKIGHACLTDSYLLSGEDQPTCTKCDTVLTVMHIPVDCPQLRDINNVDTFKNVFQRRSSEVYNQNIIGFIKDAHFYSTRNARIASAVLATAIPSVRLSVRPSVHHTPVLCQNDGT